MSQELHKQAIERELAKDFAGAAEVYLKLKIPEKAAFMFQKAGDVEKAIGVWAQFGQPVRAAEIAQKAGLHAKAAGFFEQLKRPAEAAHSWLKAGEPMKAAALFEQAGKLEEAARLLAGQNRHLEAARLFERAKRFAEAAYEYSLVPEAGDILRAMPRPDEQRAVADMLADAGHTGRAAFLYAACHQLGEALLVLLMRNEVEKAAALAREAISDAASEIVDILPRDGETFKKAAKMLVMAGDAKGAARVAEAHGGGELAGDILLEAGRPREAVTAYSKLNNYLKTAKALAAAGDHARALDLFRSLDAHAEAAACLEALGRFLDAGKTYFKARDYEGARRVLSKIPAGAEGHVQAEVLLKTMGERQT